jgi:hypothetical protein
MSMIPDEVRAYRKAAAQERKQSMIKNVVENILAEVETAARQFGTYAFVDKGAVEVMDIDRLTADLEAMDPEDLAEVLCELLARQGDDFAYGELMPRLVSDLLCELQGVDDETWDVLMSHPELEEVF